MLATLQLRAIGLTGLATSLAQAGSKSPTSVANLLDGQAQLLSASDIVWAELFRLPANADADEVRREGRDRPAVADRLES